MIVSFTLGILLNKNVTEIDSFISSSIVRFDDW